MNTLVSKEQLYNCADIQVIDADDGFLTAERLKSFQIQPVSIVDVLNCFPNREETTTTNENRREFRLWTRKQDERWWSQLFHHISQTMTDKLLQKPIFLLENSQQRCYLPTSGHTHSLLFIMTIHHFECGKDNSHSYGTLPNQNELLFSNQLMSNFSQKNE